MLNKFSLAAGLVFFLVLAATVGAPQYAAASKGGKEGRAKGVITAVDVNARTLTIQDRKTGSATVQITDATQLRVDSKKNATLADVSVGDTADARFDAATHVASRVDVKRAKLEGTITAIDLNAQKVTIQPLSGAAVTVQANATTKIERNDVHATLADFKVGDRGEAKYNAQTLIASKIEAEGN